MITEKEVRRKLDEATTLLNKYLEQKISYIKAQSKVDNAYCELVGILSDASLLPDNKETKIGE